MKEPLKTLIVEDEIWPQKQLIKLVEGSPELKLSGIASSVQQFKDEVKKYSYDLILLDIGLHGENAFDFLKECQFQGYVIVTTGNQNYALDAYNLDVIDFLLKPISQKRFQHGIEKVLKAGGKPSEERYDSKERDLEELLCGEYGLSKTEIAICVYIAEGVERSQIERFLEIAPETLKSHLRKIYKKTVDSNTEDSSASHGKFQRLTTFLYSLNPPHTKGKLI